MWPIGCFASGQFTDICRIIVVIVIVATVHHSWSTTAFRLRPGPADFVRTLHHWVVIVVTLHVVQQSSNPNVQQLLPVSQASSPLPSSNWSSVQRVLVDLVRAVNSSKRHPTYFATRTSRRTVSNLHQAELLHASRSRRFFFVARAFCRHAKTGRFKVQRKYSKKYFFKLYISVPSTTKVLFRLVCWNHNFHCNIECVVPPRLLKANLHCSITFSDYCFNYYVDRLSWYFINANHFAIRLIKF